MVGEKVPAAHRAQRSAPGVGMYDPRAHGVGALAPEVATKNPGGARRHSVLRDAFEKEPALQGVHADRSSRAREPAPHAAQAELFCAAT